jgi:hypothetical protein
MRIHIHSGVFFNLKFLIFRSYHLGPLQSLTVRPRATTILSGQMARVLLQDYFYEGIYVDSPVLS